MDEIIQIKCPFDGAVLSIKNQPGLESKSVTCPVCKHKYPFTEFKRVFPKSAFQNGGNEGGEYTDYAYSKKTFTEEPTELPEINLTLGRIRLQGSNLFFQLKPGRNVIGRKAQKTNAQIQIDTADKRTMSREHIVIEIKKLPQKGFVHYITLFKEKVNKTYVGNNLLVYGDCLVLNHGDIIKLPDATLLFEIPDNETTELHDK